MNKGLSKKSKILIICIIAGALLIVGILALVSSMMPQQEILPKVGAIAVENGEVKEQLDVTGVVRSMETKIFFSPVNAEIKEMDFETGDVISKGTKMIDFDTKDLEKNNEKAELNIRSGELDVADAVNQDSKNANKQATAAANANALQGAVDQWQAYVDDLKWGINQANVDAQNDAIDAAGEASAAAIEKYNNDVINYNAEMDRLWTNYENALHAFNQADTDYELAKEAGNQTDINSKSQTRSVAEGTLIKAEYAYNSMSSNPPTMGVGFDSGSGMATADTYELQVELEHASAYLAELKGELASEKAKAEAEVGGLTAETKEKMEIGTDLAEMESKTIEELIAEGKKGIQAEFSGVVSDVRVQKGATVAQGMELFTLHSLDKVSVDVKISKYDYAKVKEGQKATITLANNEYQGTVTKIDRIALPDAQGNPTIEATVSIDNPDENVFIGVEAKVVIQANEAADVPIVPSEVVNIGKEGSFCYVIEDSVVVKRAVETGVASTSSIEIRSGLSAGDVVITELGDLKEGDKVEGVDPAELEANPLNDMMMMMQQ